MATKFLNRVDRTKATTGRGKKTAQGRRNVAFATMNKEKKSSFKKYRGQGR
jgi:hypothetical protein